MEDYNDDNNNNNDNDDEDDENKEDIKDKDEAVLTDWMAIRTMIRAMAVFMVNDDAESEQRQQETKIWGMTTGIFDMNTP